MYDELLVPTDGSEATDAAVDHAVALASRFDARIRALYVVDANVYATIDTGMDGVMEMLETQGHEAVSHVRDAASAAGVPVEEEIAHGRVHETIRDRAAETETDLIVMATHGRQGLDRYLLGSVTERVVRTADQPVLTVRNSGE